MVALNECMMTSLCDRYLLRETSVVVERFLTACSRRSQHLAHSGNRSNHPFSPSVWKACPITGSVFIWLTSWPKGRTLTKWKPSWKELSESITTGRECLFDFHHLVLPKKGQLAVSSEDMMDHLLLLVTFIVKICYNYDTSQQAKTVTIEKIVAVPDHDPHTDIRSDIERERNLQSCAPSVVLHKSKSSIRIQTVP